MKVRCVNNSGYKDFLTMKKVYEVIGETKISYIVESDIQVKIEVSKCRFELTRKFL